MQTTPFRVSASGVSGDKSGFHFSEFPAAALHVSPILR
jgi:hypothetical protein